MKSNAYRFFLGLIFLSSSSFAATLSLDGYLPAKLEKGKFRVTISVTGVADVVAQRGRSEPADEFQQLKNRIGIVLPDISPLMLPAEQPATSTHTFEEEPLFAIHELRKHIESSHTDGSWSYVYYIEIDEKTPGALKAHVVDGKLKLSAAFYLGGLSAENLIAQEENIILTTEPGLQDMDPPEVGIVSRPGHFDFLWTAEARPNEQLPSEMKIVVIAESAGKTLSLPAYKISRIPGVPDSPTTCSYASGVGYCLDCAGDYYLNMDALADIPGVTIVSAKTDDLAASSNQLSAGSYFVMSQFGPKGVVQSECERGFVY